MANGHLLRGHAPISEAGWALIDEEAKARLTAGLAARRLVDFSGPKGWEHSAVDLGRVAEAEISPLDHVEGRVRRVQPLVEVRARFTVSRAELAAGDRGAEDVDFADLDAAAQRMVVSENTAVFHGWSEAGIDGIARVSPHDAIPCGDEVERYPSFVARAVETLLRNGVAGPYGLALGREEYTRVIETAERGGVLLFDHLRQILGGPIVWAPGVDGGVVLSQRGGDFLFESGQDIAVGYESHDAGSVTLYLEESFAFRVASPEAAVAIVR
ncbi:MAG TPA: family 1 encapsulin nanocompartment shell protein [Baekduia sp.]|uniref:family 1 encapsulin nanocompartment shell protein n=1 Tax=Baekduia sp. TaxID=2600305 RepID=UPI002D7684E0|nr:family 1 encapsulin nanocompartment shell protein [Baekduia sp.]HET6507615.1 family 1 encapsulin nanocompartment shell protein [Baekduia sp.]